MSGGSYNYLFTKEPEELFGWSAKDDLEDMADSLAQLGYAEDAARETLDLLLKVRQIEVHLATRLKRLNDVWPAMEWWHSGDSSEDEVKRALARYRGEEDGR